MGVRFRLDRASTSAIVRSQLSQIRNRTALVPNPSMAVSRDKLLALRDAPAYHVPDAAAYVGVPVSTLRSWIRSVARTSAPLIAAADATRGILSFNNLVEAHILRIFRQQHKVRLPKIREALDYASRELRMPRPLLSKRLETDGVGIFIDHLGALTDLTTSGALYLRALLEDQLHRVDWDERELAYRLYPQVTGAEHGQKPLIAIDPALSFGRPIILRRAIATEAVVARIDSGESVDEVVQDLGLTKAEVTAAVMFEHQAA